jgi:hypothetical protein
MVLVQFLQVLDRLVVSLSQLFNFLGFFLDLLLLLRLLALDGLNQVADVCLVSEGEFFAVLSEFGSQERVDCIYKLET